MGRRMFRDPWTLVKQHGWPIFRRKIVTFDVFWTTKSSPMHRTSAANDQPISWFVNIQNSSTFCWLFFWFGLRKRTHLRWVICGKLEVSDRCTSKTKCLVNVLTSKMFNLGELDKSPGDLSNLRTWELENHPTNVYKLKCNQSLEVPNKNLTRRIFFLAKPVERSCWFNTVEWIQSDKSAAITIFIESCLLLGPPGSSRIETFLVVLEVQISWDPFLVTFIFQLLFRLR